VCPGCGPVGTGRGRDGVRLPGRFDTSAGWSSPACCRSRPARSTCCRPGEGPLALLSLIASFAIAFGVVMVLLALKPKEHAVVA
jgi:hypothetical protein